MAVVFFLLLNAYCIVEHWLWNLALAMMELLTHTFENLVMQALACGMAKNIHVGKWLCTTALPNCLVHIYAVFSICQ